MHMHTQEPNRMHAGSHVHGWMAKWLFPRSTGLYPEVSNVCLSFICYSHFCATNRGSRDSFVCTINSIIFHHAKLQLTADLPLRTAKRLRLGLVPAVLVWYVRYDIRGRKADYYGLRW